METVPLLLHLSQGDFETLEALRSKLVAMLGEQLTVEDTLRYCILYAASSEDIRVDRDEPTFCS